MKIMVLDNYDSFTFNLVHYLEELLDQDIDVYRNDEISLEKINDYDAIVLSPGPGLPKDAGILIQLVQKYYQSKKILGICLGHQAIIEAFGGRLKQLEEVLHGMSHETKLIKPSDVIFHNIPKLFECGRYHSWVADIDQLPTDLEIIATDHDNEVMAIKHKFYPIYGLQFHPESILTENGKQLLNNWLNA